MNDQYNTSSSHNRWLQPTTLLLLVVIVSSVVVWLFTINWSALNQPEVRSTPAVVKVAPADEARLVREYSPVVGPKSAPLTIVEFSDFECPFCAESFPVVREMLNKYSNQVQFVYRHFPVESIHPDSFGAAVASQCANAQGKFMVYHDRLFINQSSLDEESLLQYAIQSGLDINLFEECIGSEVIQNQVRSDMSDGVALGVRATPTWFIDGRKVEGAIPKDLFFEVVDAVLAQSTGGK